MDDSPASSERRSAPRSLLDILLWVIVLVSAVAAWFVGTGRSEPYLRQQDYFVFYSALSVVLCLVLAIVLLLPLRTRSEPKLMEIAPLAFLLAVMLHITVWGVGASKWVAGLQPRFGNALWLFLVLVVGPAMLLSATYIFRLRRERRVAAEKPSSRRRYWYAAWSGVFVILFAIAGWGAYETARSIRGDWFPGELATGTFLIAIVTVLVLTEVLVSLVRADIQPNPVRKAEAAKADAAVTALIVVGPLVGGAVLLAAAVVGLLFSDLGFRFSTGLTLFLSYATALFPSWGVTSALGILRAGP